MWDLSVPKRGGTALVSPLSTGELSLTSGNSKVEFVCPARTPAKRPTPNRTETKETLLVLHLPKEMEEGLTLGSVRTGVADMVHSI